MALEEHLRAIKGFKMYCSIDPFELCLVLNVVVLKKFKVLKFEKYKRAMNPRIVIIRYNDKLLIPYFYKSLTGVALKWFLHLDVLVWKAEKI